VLGIGVPTVAVFETSPTAQTLQQPPGPTRTLCDVSVCFAESEDQQVRSCHLVQVQSPISTAYYNISKISKIYININR
jgi:hypothetical protein